MTTESTRFEDIDVSHLEASVSVWLDTILLSESLPEDLITLCNRVGLYTGREVRLSWEEYWDSPLGSAIVFGINRPDLNWYRVILDSRVEEPVDRMIMFGHEIGHILLDHEYRAAGGYPPGKRNEEEEQWCERFGEQLAQRTLNTTA